MVDCPLESYDMKPFVTKSHPNAGMPDQNGDGTNAEPAEPETNGSAVPTTQTQTQNLWTNFFKKSDKAEQSIIPDKNSFVYDLYAVCNHHGEDLQGGHYTATCRCVIF